MVEFLASDAIKTEPLNIQISPPSNRNDPNELIMKKKNEITSRIRSPTKEFPLLFIMKVKWIQWLVMTHKGALAHTHSHTHTHINIHTLTHPGVWVWKLEQIDEASDRSSAQQRTEKLSQRKYQRLAKHSLSLYTHTHTHSHTHSHTHVFSRWCPLRPIHIASLRFPLPARHHPLPPSFFTFPFWKLETSVR